MNEGDREGRAYIIVSCDNEETLCFWYSNNCGDEAEIGDYVRIESAVAERRNIIIATSIQVVKN